MEMCFLDTLAMITLRVRQTEQAFLQEVAVLQLDSIAGNQTHSVQAEAGLTLRHSRMQKQCSVYRVYQTHLQFHLHPSGKFSILHDRE